MIIRSSSRNKALPLELSFNCSVTGKRGNHEYLNRVEVGDYLLSVNGDRCSGKVCRELLARAHNAGGPVELVLWRPPPNYVPAAPGPQGAHSASSALAALQQAARAAAKQMPPSEKLNLRRLCCRLEGGPSDSNLKRICCALCLAPEGQKTNEAAIEFRLRQLEFGDASFNCVPTAADMRLSEKDFAARMQLSELPEYPGFYLMVQYSIAQLCTKMAELLASRSG